MKNTIRNRFRIIAFSILFAIVFLLQKHTLGQTIIYPGNGSNAELLAAKEVRRYIYMRTDSLLDIQAVSTLPSAGDLILVAKDNSSITSLVDGLELGHVPREDQIVLKTVNTGERTILVITGYDDHAVLVAAYRYAEKIGCYFDLAGDVIPDTKTSVSITGCDEVGEPRFEMNGILPFHDFHQGPDLWSTSDYKSIISQLPKMGMNFIGLKTYPKHSIQEEKVSSKLEQGPEPNVWVGLVDDLDANGNVKWSYPAFYAHSHRPHQIWGTAMMNTGDFYAGSREIFPTDYWGSEVMGTSPLEAFDPNAYTASDPREIPFPTPNPPNPFPNNAAQVTYFNDVFNQTGDMFAEAFAHAHGIGVKTALGTELPMGLEKEGTEVGADWVRGIPQVVIDHITAPPYNKPDPILSANAQTVQDIYTGIFERLKRKHALPNGGSSLDYYWLWTWEVWQNWDMTSTQIQAIKDDINLAEAALTSIGNPFQIAMAGWKTGSSENATEFEDVLPTDVPFMALWDEADEGRLGLLDPNRKKWAATWFEEDWGLNQPQLGLPRIYQDIVSAADPNINANGMLAKHWRTRAVSVNSGAMKDLVWSYGTTSSPPSTDVSSIPPLNTWVSNYWETWFEKMFGVNSSTDISVATAITNIAALDNNGEPYPPADPEDPGYTPNPNVIQTLNYWISHEEPFADDMNTAPAAISPNVLPWSEMSSWPAFTIVDDLENMRPQVTGTGNLERFDYFLKSFQIYRLTAQYGEKRNEFNIAFENEDWPGVLAARQAMAPIFDEIIQLHLEKATSLGDIGEIMSLNILDWEALVKYQSNWLTENEGGLTIPANANPKSAYVGNEKHIKVVHPLTMFKANQAINVECFQVGDLSSPILYYRKLGTGSFTALYPSNTSRQCYTFNIPGQNSDFEYYIESGSTRFPATAMNTTPTYHTVIVNENPIVNVEEVDESLTSEPIVYPNPNNGSFNVDLGKKYKNVVFIITNTLGQFVQSNAYNDIQHFNSKVAGPSGAYFMIFKLNNKKTVIRVVKKINTHIMKFTLKLLTFGLSLMIFNACDKNDNTTLKPQSTSINRILPLGASRVEGARPEYESFRYDLWKDLIDGGWTFDFIGTQSDNASYPSYSGDHFDADHEGRGGWTSEQILDGLNDWLSETDSPDIVLFSSPGGNDALEGLPYEEAVDNINEIIDIIQAQNPNVTIIIEQMAPGRSDIMTSDLTSFFDQMQQEVLSIATNQSTSTSQVIAVDMFTGFSDSFLADDVHYNAAGAEFIANRYYDVLENILEE